MTTSPNLTDRLDHYSTTAKGQVAKGPSMTQIAGYASAAGAGLAMASAADAAIVYSGVQNIMVSLDPAVQATGSATYQITGTGIDMDGGGDDFNLLAGFVGAIDGPSSAKYVGAGYLEPDAGAEFLGGTGGVAGANLASGALIGPGGAFADTNAGYGRQAVYSGGTLTGGLASGNFAAGTTGFVGIQLGSGNYGWIRLRLDDLGPNQPFATTLAGGGLLPIGNGQGYIDKVTVVDWAYDDSGAAIRAGQIPEPGSLALLAAGAAGIGAFRRRKAARA
jgi:hypothetical protein